MTRYCLYLDVAGHPVDQPYLCIAGFVASEAQWLLFEKDWNACLAKHKIDPPFHATKFYFANKNNPKKRHIESDLVRIIGNHAKACFSLCVDLAAYKEANDLLIVEEVHGTPYALITRGLLNNIEDWKEIVSFSSPILIFVESGTLHEGDMRECLTSRDGLPEPIPVPKSLAACQAADLYAFAVFQCAKTRIESDLLRKFHQKFSFPQERRNGFIRRQDIINSANNGRAEFTSEGKTVLLPIPPRAQVEGKHNFNFPGSTKRSRMRRIK